MPFWYLVNILETFSEYCGDIQWMLRQYNSTVEVAELFTLLLVKSHGWPYNIYSSINLYKERQLQLFISQNLYKERQPNLFTSVLINNEICIKNDNLNYTRSCYVLICFFPFIISPDPKSHILAIVITLHRSFSSSVKTIQLVFTVSPHAHYGVRVKTVWLVISMMCPSGAACLPVELFYWTSTIKILPWFNWKNCTFGAKQQPLTHSAKIYHTVCS